MPNVNELFSLKGRTAIVTGGGQGLGKSMAIGLAQAGADIVIAERIIVRDCSQSRHRGVARCIFSKRNSRSIGDVR